MRKTHVISRGATVVAIGALAFSLTGCGGYSPAQDSFSAEDIAAKTLVSVSEATTAGIALADTVVTQTPATGSVSNSLLATEDMFSDRDLRQEADTSAATYLTVSDGQTIDITEEGVYVLSGTATNASVVVTATSDSKVQLVLDGLSIENDNLPAIYVKSADKVFITTTQDSINTLSVMGEFVSDGEINTDSVIFSKDDLVFNGLGTLTVGSSNNGITSKDDIKFTGGTYEIAAAADAIEANDSIRIADGAFTVWSAKDGMHCENDDDATGYIYISGGTFDIEASDDGIQATEALQIDGGTFEIVSSEGLEATYVQINGGTIAIEASDDGINASYKSTTYSPTIEVNGGDITVSMGQGDTDAFDANGDIYINGGTVSIYANSPFDFDRTGQITGGTVYVNDQQITTIQNSMMGPGGGMGGPMGGGMGGRGGR